jgi:O-acetyl-ADP-ribose deacetylase (regulator of RNase III)
MIREIYGDLLQVDANIICHQVNIDGVMGAGVAWAIRNKLLTPQQYKTYQIYCASNREYAIGSVLYSIIESGRRYVANVFSQNCYADEFGSLTNYAAVREGLNRVCEFAFANGLSVALPGFYGCGIAGGNWDVVRNIIYQVFDTAAVECKIVYYQSKEE